MQRPAAHYPGMGVNRYEVIDHSTIGPEVALRDQAGRFHIAQTATERPLVGTELTGAQAKPGFDTLLSTRTGQMYRVIFDLVDCSRRRRFDPGAETQVTSRPDRR